MYKIIQSKIAIAENYMVQKHCRLLNTFLILKNYFLPCYRSVTIVKKQQSKLFSRKVPEIIFKDTIPTFNQLLEKENIVCIHTRNLPFLAVEIYCYLYAFVIFYL